MIITLSGITGCGKSYYKNFLVQKMNIENMVIYTTRERRKTEINGIDKNFVTREEFQKLIENKELFANYDFLEEKYGYGSKYLEENMISVTELHYEWIADFKEKAENVYSIYIIPKSVKDAQEQLINRKLPKEIEEKRLKEIEEHIYKIEHDQNLKKQFDVIFYNDYTEKSDKNMMKLINKIIKENCQKTEAIFM